MIEFQGMDSGFAEDDSYNVYDKPWRKDQEMAKSLYRHSKSDKDVYGDDLEKLMGTNRLVGNVMHNYCGAELQLSSSIRLLGVSINQLFLFAKHNSQSGI